MDRLRLQGAARLDRQALEGIYKQYSPLLFRYAYRLLGDSELAEECVSETFSRYLNALRNGNGPGEHLKAYLYRISHNWITDYFRRQQPDPLDVDLHADPRGNPAHVVAGQLEQERVRAALRRLTPEQRRVVVLRFLEEWSHKEIAALIGCSVEATRSLQYRALSVLRRLLIEQEEEYTHEPNQ